MSQNQNTGRSYAEVGQSGSDNQRWEPQKNIGNPQYPTQLEGYFRKFTELPGKNPGTTFHVAEIQMVNQDGSLGQLIDVSGGKVLEEKLRVISLGSFIMIQFKGKVQGKLNAYNDWATFIDEGAIPLHQLMGVTAPVQPFQQSAPVQQQAPAFGQPAQQSNPFGNAPAAQQQAPVFNQAPPAQQQSNPFQAAPAQNSGAPVAQQVFQTSAPGSNPAFQQAAPVQGNGQFPGQPAANPFAQQNGDLPFN